MKDQFEEYVKNLDENIESVTTCLAETTDGEKENGIVLTIKGVDVVLLQSDLETIADYLNEELIFN